MVLVKAMLPKGLPATDFSPPIRENAGMASGSRTAPTLWRRPLGAKVFKKEFQSKVTLVVFNIKFKRP